MLIKPALPEDCKMKNFRIDEQTGSVYKLNAQQDAFVFIGKLNGRTEDQFFCDLFNNNEDDDHEFNDR